MKANGCAGRRRRGIPPPRPRPPPARPGAPRSPGRRASSPAFSPSLAPLARSVIAPANRAVRRACLRARFALSRPEGCPSLRAGPCRVAALPERPRPSWGPWVSGVERLGRGSGWGCSGHSELSAASRRTRASVRRVRGWRGHCVGDEAEDGEGSCPRYGLGVPLRSEKGAGPEPEAKKGAGLGRQRGEGRSLALRGRSRVGPGAGQTPRGPSGGSQFTKRVMGGA